MRCKKHLVIWISVLLLSACGGSSDDAASPPVTTTSTGVFLDSPVEGLHYETATQSGTTNSAGEYEYVPGETVTFSIGGIVLGSTLAGPVVTPLSLVAGAVDVTNPVVTNIARLLLSLDDDGNPDNGIRISAAVTAAAAGLTVDFTVADLANDAGIISLLNALPSITLVDALTAQMHLRQTLGAQSVWGGFVWGSGTWQSTSP